MPLKERFQQKTSLQAVSSFLYRTRSKTHMRAHTHKKNHLVLSSIYCVGKAGVERVFSSEKIEYKRDSLGPFMRKIMVASYLGHV